MYKRQLYNSEFVKEGRDWFLRVYIDKLPAAQIETVHADTAGAAQRETCLLYTSSLYREDR